MIQIIGSEYHYGMDNIMPDQDLRIFLHFFQKILSLFLIVIYSLYFLQKKNAHGVHQMLNETVFHYLDGILEELIEDVKESTSIFYNQAYKAYKKQMTDQDLDSNEKEFFSHSDNGSKTLYPRKYPSHSIHISSNMTKTHRKRVSKDMLRSKTNYSLHGLEIIQPKRSREEFIFNDGEREIRFYNTKGDANVLEFEDKKMLDEIEEQPVLQLEPPSVENSEPKIKKNESFVFNLNPSLDIYRNFYICSCYECCCECCCNCWFELFFDKLSRIYLKFKQQILISLIIHSKTLCFCFIIVGVSFEISLRNAFAILVSDCLENKLNGYFIILFALFTIMDLFLGAVFFSANVFLISFLTTRREFLAVNPSDKKTRGRMIFYHLNKAFTYGFFHFIFQMVFKIIFIFKRPFYEVDEGSDTALFALLKYTFLFLFIMHNYHNWKSTVLIQDDCDILKFQNRYFTIQNTFLKFVPNQKTLLRFLKLYIYGKNLSSSSIMNSDSPRSLRSNSFSGPDFVQNLSKDLEMNLCNVKLQLDEQLNIVDKQKFRRILKNRGVYPILQLIIIYFLLVSSFIYMMVASVCLVSLNVKDYQFIDPIYRLLYISIFILNISEFTLIPILFKYSLKRKYYLDFEGENSWFWEKEEQKEEDHNENF